MNFSLESLTDISPTLTTLTYVSN